MIIWQSYNVLNLETWNLNHKFERMLSPTLPLYLCLYLNFYYSVDCFLLLLFFNNLVFYDTFSFRSPMDLVNSWTNPLVDCEQDIKSINLNAWSESNYFIIIFYKQTLGHFSLSLFKSKFYFKIFILSTSEISFYRVHHKKLYWDLEVLCLRKSKTLFDGVFLSVIYLSYLLLYHNWFVLYW